MMSLTMSSINDYVIRKSRIPFVHEFFDSEATKYKIYENMPDYRLNM